jgi:hypothetical protein
MNFSKLRLKNFKGFKSQIEFELKPLTFFYGPNSSGKSSVIHALAALSQTIKLTNNRRPLILDDEHAVINLGRFIEVIHSKAYSDKIEIGFDLPKSPILKIDGSGGASRDYKDIFCDLSFGCTKKTQEIYLNKAHFIQGELDIVLDKTTSGHRFTLSPSGAKGAAWLQKGFLGEEAMYYSALLKNNKTPDSHNLFNDLYAINQGISSRLTNTRYLGPFRQPPSRKYATYGSLPNEVGSQGEACMTLLANEAIQSAKQPHISQIGTWLTLLGLGKKVRLERIGKSDSFGVDITLSDDTSLPIADLGFGLSQVLPVLAQCSFAPKESTLLFEQPELHVHPMAQGPLTEVFVDVIYQKKCQVVAETHSPELIRSALRLLRSGKLKLEDLAIYKIERQNKASVAIPINITELNGDFDVETDWERDFCA